MYNEKISIFRETVILLLGLFMGFFLTSLFDIMKERLPYKSTNIIIAVVTSIITMILAIIYLSWVRDIDKGLRRIVKRNR